MHAACQIDLAYIFLHNGPIFRLSWQEDEPQSSWAVSWDYCQFNSNWNVV